MKRLILLFLLLSVTAWADSRWYGPNKNWKGILIHGDAVFCVGIEMALDNIFWTGYACYESGDKELEKIGLFINYALFSMNIDSISSAPYPYPGKDSLNGYCHPETKQIFIVQDTSRSWDGTLYHEFVHCKLYEESPGMDKKSNEKIATDAGNYYRYLAKKYELYRYSSY